MFQELRGFKSAKQDQNTINEQHKKGPWETKVLFCSYVEAKPAVKIDNQMPLQQRVSRYVFYELADTLRHHCVCNLEETGDVCAKDQVAGVAIRCCGL